jgi:hypothetical protein
VCHLDLPAPRRFLDASLHRARDPVGVEQRSPVHVSRGTSHRLNERSIAPQESLLVGIEDRNQ